MDLQFFGAGYHTLSVEMKIVNYLSLVRNDGNKFLIFFFYMEIFFRQIRIYFFAGKCVELAQSLFVTREDPDSRQKVKEKIVERTSTNNGWPQLLIFPEGSTSNR